jgi:hypothetical protein
MSGIARADACGCAARAAVALFNLSSIANGNKNALFARATESLGR